MNEEFLKLVQAREINSAIGASTLRGQPKGTVSITQEFLKNLDLDIFKEIDLESEFLEKFNEQTNLLKDKIFSRSWGISRKALNIFLFHGINNIFLNQRYNLNKIIPFMELTLDNPNAKRLIKKEKEKGIELNWINITKLSKEDSDKLQDFAKSVAKEHGCERCYLDLYFWRGNMEK